MPHQTHGTMTRSPKALAGVALAVARDGLPVWSATRSRHDFTTHQLFAILVLRQFWGKDYRSMVEILKDLPDLQSTLGLTKVPHFTTLQKAEQRLIKKGLSGACSALFSVEPDVVA